MQRFLINVINCALLIVILIGIPAITHAHIGHWQISSTPTAEKLTFGGLVFAIAANVLVATIFLKNPKTKESCAKWVFVFVGILFLEYAFGRGWFNFDWLKNFLLWLQKHF
jgi:uncharacterized membrane protein